MPKPLTDSQLFSDTLDLSSTLDIISDTFFLKPGESYQLEVLKEENGVTTSVASASTGTKYWLDVDSSIAEISPNGLLSIKSTYLPLVTSRAPIRVFALNEDSLGIGQFAIYDVDSDQDLIVDSYEEKVGLSKNSINNITKDSDSDRLPDLYETLLNTSPLKADTDDDLFDDIFELYAGTNPNDKNSIPINTSINTSGQEFINKELFISDLYPVPSLDQVSIDIKSTKMINLKISLMDILGRTHRVKKITLLPSTVAETITFNLSDLDNGYYLLTFLDDRGRFFTKEMVKKPK